VKLITKEPGPKLCTNEALRPVRMQVGRVAVAETAVRRCFKGQAGYEKACRLSRSSHYTDIHGATSKERAGTRGYIAAPSRLLLRDSAPVKTSGATASASDLEICLATHNKYRIFRLVRSYRRHGSFRRRHGSHCWLRGGG
jgi:hypothetical protein